MCERERESWKDRRGKTKEEKGEREELKRRGEREDEIKGSRKKGNRE